MRFPAFIGPSYTLPSVNVDCQRCVNWFPEINALGTGKEKEVACLLPTPGKHLRVTLPNSPVRGLWRSSKGTYFAVGGNKLYQISSAWVATELGSLNTSTGAVSMADNGINVFMVDGSFGYYFDINGGALTVCTDPNFYAADRVTFQDGYFIFNKTGTQVAFFSDLYALTFDALDTFTAEASPDNLVCVVSANQNVYAFSAQSTEVFYNSGDANNVFVRNQGAVNGVGCYAAHSVSVIDGVPYFLGGNELGSGVVYRLRGFTAERVSTPAIEAAIRNLDQSTLSTTRAWSYQQGGHSFYCLNLPNANKTWVYDASTSLWHERVYMNLWSLERDRADCHAVFNGKNVVGDYSNGKIYSLEEDYYFDDTTPIKRIRSSPHLSEGLKLIRHNSFQLDMETGVGTTGAGQGVDPQVMLRFSDDGGHKWSNEKYASAGKIGQTKTRAIYRRLGMSRDRVYEVSITDPVKAVLIGAELDLEGGMA